MLMLALFTPSALAAPRTSTVYLMRHCSRSTYLPDLYGGQQPQYLANYTNGGDLPDWGVLPQLCTARGRRIVTGQGRALRSEFLEKLRGPENAKLLKVIYDAGYVRDNTTAEDFLVGLGLADLIPRPQHADTRRVQRHAPRQAEAKRQTPAHVGGVEHSVIAITHRVGEQFLMRVAPHVIAVVPWLVLAHFVHGG